jgi:O-antigen ligase
MNSRLAGGAPSRALSPAVMTLLIVVPFALIAAYGAIVLAGTKTGAALALIAVVGPLAAYFALTKPLLFPFCLFVILVPFDNLLSFSSWGTLTKLLGILCGAAIVFWLLRSKRYVVPDRSLLGWAGFAFLAIGSMAWAIDPATGSEALLTLLELFLMYAVLSFMPLDTKTLTAIVWSIILSGTIAAAYGAYLFERGIDVGSSGRLIIGSSATVNVGARIDPNHFAASLLVPIALAIVAAVESKGLFVRVVAALCLLILGAGIAFAGSRGALLAIVAMLVYLIIRSRKRLAFALVSVACLGAGLALWGNVLLRFAGAMASGGAGRLDIWRVGLRAFLLHPFIGAGFGNFPLAYDQVYVATGITQNLYWNQEPHNNLLLVGVELGILGLAVFLYAWWQQFVSLRVIPPQDGFYPLRIAAEAGLIGLFVASLFLGTITYKYLWLAFMFVVLTRNCWLTVRPRAAQPGGTQ